VTIQVKCAKCGTRLKAPDALAGKKAKCPGCGAVLEVPAAEEEILDAELAEPAPAAPPDPGSLLDETEAYDLEHPKAAAEAAAESRRPCPACGEMIVSTAAKCRFCGEIFDATLKRKAKKQTGTYDDEMSTGDWVVAILCPGIGCIAGIIWLIMGKPKAGKVIGVSICAIVVWNILSFVIQELAKH
jgi:predicted RNA-binding Zn-ribbon protein involved in translation (DUF1610 family)